MQKKYLLHLTPHIEWVPSPIKLQWYKDSTRRDILPLYSRESKPISSRCNSDLKCGQIFEIRLSCISFLTFTGGSVWVVVSGVGVSVGRISGIRGVIVIIIICVHFRFLTNICVKSKITASSFEFLILIQKSKLWDKSAD